MSEKDRERKWELYMEVLKKYIILYSSDSASKLAKQDFKELWKVWKEEVE